MRLPFGDRVVAVGTTATIAALASPATRRIALGGRVVAASTGHGVVVNSAALCALERQRRSPDSRCIGEAPEPRTSRALADTIA